MAAYYNEFDPYAAQWLRNLIKNKLIADGEVDERSIRDVAATDVRGFTQCHFFAGIGVWSHALRLAGWPDDRPVWTGSCPCQPFSAAGQGKGFDDERHLWPEFHRLIAECRPPVVFGEQVASKDGLGWLDTVHADLEASGYAVGAVDLCAAGVGAPHIRQRLWFVGERLDDTTSARHARALAGPEGNPRDETRLRLSGERRGLGGLGDTDSPRHEGHGLQSVHGEWQGREPLGGATGSGAIVGLADTQYDDRRANEPGRGSQGRTADGRSGANGGLADAAGSGRLARVRHDDARRQKLYDERGRQASKLADGGLADASSSRQPGESGGSNPQGQRTAERGVQADARPTRPTNGQWRDADWLHCRDGKWRPVEPGTFPLAHGAPARVGRLRAYGNAIVPQVAAEVIGAYLET